MSLNKLGYNQGGAFYELELREVDDWLDSILDNLEKGDGRRKQNKDRICFQDLQDLLGRLELAGVAAINNDGHWSLARLRSVLGAASRGR